jgi:hypothetical protein
VPGHQLRLFEGSDVCEVDGFTLRKKPDTEVVSKRSVFETFGLAARYPAMG